MYYPQVPREGIPGWGDGKVAPEWSERHAKNRYLHTGFSPFIVIRIYLYAIGLCKLYTIFPKS